MKKSGLFKFIAALAVLMIGMVPSLVLGANVYDLQSDWSNSSNPNGPWAFWQGTTLLIHQVGTGSPMPSGVDFWAPGQSWGSFLPLWYQGTDGSVYTHSMDPYNGNAALGESILTWTSPSDGTIDIAGSIWYAQITETRSNDFALYIGSTLLASGMVSYSNYNSKSTAFAFSSSDIGVHSGDVLSLVINRTSGQTWGSMAGVVLTIAETPGTVPLPAAVWLFAPGLLGLWGMRRKLNH